MVKQINAFKYLKIEINLILDKVKLEFPLMEK